jgi:hypothetical protein
MKVTILHEAGYLASLFGLGLSHGLTSDTTPAELDVATLDRLHQIAFKLCDSDGGHNKFLESIQVWLDIDAPRFWWSEFDTYRVGVSKQSESTMHTLIKRELMQDDFEHPISKTMLALINRRIGKRTATAIDKIKNDLPEGFLQRRIVSTNYKALRGMILQRKSHRLPQWHIFIDALRGLEHGELLPL